MYIHTHRVEIFMIAREYSNQKKRERERKNIERRNIFGVFNVWKQEYKNYAWIFLPRWCLGREKLLTMSQMCIFREKTQFFFLHLPWIFVKKKKKARKCTNKKCGSAAKMLSCRRRQSESERAWMARKKTLFSPLQNFFPLARIVKGDEEEEEVKWSFLPTMQSERYFSIHSTPLSLDCSSYCSAFSLKVRRRRRKKVFFPWENLNPI
jgi:hypothetical protein